MPYANTVKSATGYGDGDIEEEHESFGLIAISRVSGGRRLFGSHLEQHQHFISLTISRAKVIHGLSYDRYHPTRELIEINMSAAQFAEAITSLNSGVGATCTITDVDRVPMEGVPEEAQAEHRKIREGFEAKLADTVAELDKACEDFQTLLDNPKGISKGRAREMMKHLEHARMEIKNNTPFMVDQFRESADRVVTSAKAEIEAFALSVLHRAGMAALAKGDLPKLLLGDGDDE